MILIDMLSGLLGLALLALLCDIAINILRKTVWSITPSDMKKLRK